MLRARGLKDDRRLKEALSRLISHHLKQKKRLLQK